MVTISCDEIQEFDSDLAWEEEAEKLVEKERIKTIRSISERKKDILTEEAEPQNNNEGNFVGFLHPNEKF